MPFINKARRIDPNLRKTNVGLTKREKKSILFTVTPLRVFETN